MTLFGILVVSALVIGPGATLMLMAGALCLRSVCRDLRGFAPPRPA